MADNNYLLFYIIEKIEKNTNKDYFTKEEILDYIKPIGLFGYAHNDYNFYISIVRNIIFNINNYIENNIILQDDIKLFINKEHIYYIEYKENYINEIYKIDCINDTIILGYNEELINDKLKNLEFMDTSSESEEQELEDNYYVCESFTSNNIYFIDPYLKRCNCLSFYYSNEKNICKHIIFLQKLNEEQLNNIKKIDTKSRTCNCNSNNCKHIKAFLDCLPE